MNDALAALAGVVTLTALIVFSAFAAVGLVLERERVFFAGIYGLVGIACLCILGAWGLLMGLTIQAFL